MKHPSQSDVLSSCLLMRAASVARSQNIARCNLCIHHAPIPPSICRVTLCADVVSKADIDVVSASEALAHCRQAQLRTSEDEDGVADHVYACIARDSRAVNFSTSESHAHALFVSLCLHAPLPSMASFLRRFTTSASAAKTPLWAKSAPYPTSHLRDSSLANSTSPR